MKSLHITRIFVLLLLSAVAFGQYDAQKSFDKLKALAGAWEGAVPLIRRNPEIPDGTRAHITMRVTSRGNALVHEMQALGTPLDPTKYDHPVTMIYLQRSTDPGALLRCRQSPAHLRGGT